MEDHTRKKKLIKQKRANTSTAFKSVPTQSQARLDHCCWISWAVWRRARVLRLVMRDGCSIISPCVVAAVVSTISKEIADLEGSHTEINHVTRALLAHRSVSRFAPVSCHAISLHVVDILASQCVPRVQHGPSDHHHILCLPPTHSSPFGSQSWSRMKLPLPCRIRVSHHADLHYHNAFVFHCRIAATCILQLTLPERCSNTSLMLTAGGDQPCCMELFDSFGCKSICRCADHIP